MSFGGALILAQLGTGVAAGLVAFALALDNGPEGAVAILTAVSATTILTGLITATTLPQFARMMEDIHDD